MGGEVLAERRIRRRAGASAAVEYAQLTREWRQRNRRFFQWGAAICFIIVALALLLGLGQLRGWLCGLLAGITLAFYILVRETPPAWIGQYLTGAVGEERTAKAVEPLLRAGWFIAHDLDRGQFNIDHVLVGPAGVFVLETKNLHGTVLLDCDQATLTRPGRERPDYQGSWWAREGRAHAADANSFFRQRVQVRPWVTAVVVLWADFPQRQHNGDKVTFVHGDDLVTWLRSQPERLKPDQVERLRAALEPRHRSKTDRVTPAA